MGKMHRGRDKNSNTPKTSCTQPKENQVFVSHAKKGKGRGRKSYIHKHQDKRSSPPPDQKKQKKDLSQIQCYRCKKYDHYASSCRSSHKGSMKLQLLM